MENNYDLTTREGMRSALKYIRKIPVLGPVYAPTLWVLDKAIGLFEPGKAIGRQSEAAVDLIKAGKENGVKKMKVTMDEEAGMHFNAPIEGINISTSLGTKGKITIEVEYS